MLGVRHDALGDVITNGEPDIEYTETKTNDGELRREPQLQLAI